MVEQYRKFASNELAILDPAPLPLLIQRNLLDPSIYERAGWNELGDHETTSSTLTMFSEVALRRTFSHCCIPHFHSES